MSHTPADRRDLPNEAGQSAEPIRYPTNHVLGVFDTVEQVEGAVEALTAGGFLASEVEVLCGAAAADRLDRSTGRDGVAGLAIRIAEHLGVANAEMEFKEQYEQMLRDGRFILRVAAPSDARKEAASRILSEHGASLLRFFGRFTIEELVRPDMT